MDGSLPGSKIHGIFQARILEWAAVSFSREPSPPRDQTCVSCIDRWILYHWATREARMTLSSTYFYICPPCPSMSIHVHLSSMSSKFPVWLRWLRVCLQCGSLRFNPWIGNFPREGSGTLLQYSCLENPMNRGAWWATVCGVTKSRTRLNDFLTTGPWGKSLAW